MDNLIDDIGALKDELKEVKQGFEDNAPAEVQEKLFDRIEAWGKSNIEVNKTCYSIFIFRRMK